MQSPSMWPEASRLSSSCLGFRSKMALKQSVICAITDADQANTVYEPGCRFVIVCGGAVWHELMGIPEEVQKRYVDDCIEMISSPNVHFRTPCDQFPNLRSAAEIRHEFSLSFRTPVDGFRHADGPCKNRKQEWNRPKSSNTLQLANATGDAVEEKQSTCCSTVKRFQGSAMMRQMSGLMQFPIREQSNSGPKLGLNMAGRPTADRKAGSGAAIPYSGCET